MIPETLRLADYGLGHDERAEHPQPVASRLGPRFYDWQLVQSADESWRECHLHARNLLGAHEYALLLAELIERRAADGEDYLDLSDGRVHAQAARRRWLPDGPARNLLPRLRGRRSLLDHGDHPPQRRSSWTTPPTVNSSTGSIPAAIWTTSATAVGGATSPQSPSAERWLRVAEDRADYRASTPPEDSQPDLFE